MRRSEAWLSLLILIFVGGKLQAAVLTPEALLRGVWDDPRVKSSEQSVEMVTQVDSLNPIEKADIRLDRGQIDQQDIKIGLRVYPRGYSEIHSGREFQRALEQNAKNARNEALSKLLVSRYDLLARTAFLREKKQISSDLAAVAQTASQALAFAARKNRTELKSYLKTKADLEKISVKAADVDRDYAILQADLARIAQASAESFDLDDLVGMEDIRQRLNPLQKRELNLSLSAQIAQQELAVAQAENRYNRAKDEKWLEHVELSMKEDKKEKVYGVEVAINLPFVGASDLSRVSKQARELREQVKAIEASEASEQVLQGTLLELKTLLDLHRRLSETQKKMGPEQMRKASQSIAPQDPILAVELRKAWFEAREQILDLEYRIRSLFITYLHESSGIAGDPRANHLSKSNKRIL